MTSIPFNKPYLTGKETEYIANAVNSGKISGNGQYTQKCQVYFQQKYNFKKCLLTTSCTDALEMCAILADIKLGDEVIIPSYTFVSTALAFVRQGAKIIFADSRKDHPGLDEDIIESLITPKTKAIVPVHYAGYACDMDKVMMLASKYNLLVIEDAAQALDSYYKNKPLGGIGHLSVFSFHETKNIISGEGGMIVINEEKFIRRSEIIWEKGTNRSEFFRGEVNKYGWVDTGSSFLPSEIIAAFLYAQIENIDKIQNRRKIIWQKYNNNLHVLANCGYFTIPVIPDYATNNAHMFYIVCNNYKERSRLIEYLKEKKIMAVFHYLSLHKSEYYAKYYDGDKLENCDRYADNLLRLPLFYELTNEEVDYICENIRMFYEQNYFV
jgi:dTDP-4-amino-4,6-dideoxygalactose transaminase